MQINHVVTSTVPVTYKVILVRHTYDSDMIELMGTEEILLRVCSADKLDQYVKAAFTLCNLNTEDEETDSIIWSVRVRISNWHEYDSNL